MAVGGGGTIRQITLRILGDRKGAQAAIDWTNAEADKLSKRDPTLHIMGDTKDVAAKLAGLRAMVDTLTKLTYAIPIDFKDTAALAKVAALRASLIGLDKQGAKLAGTNIIDNAKFARYASSVAAVDDKFQGLARDIANVSTETEKVTRFSVTAGNAFGFWGTKLKLFGSGAHVMSVFTLAAHFLLDSLIAVTGALIALGAGVYGLSGTAIDLGHHLQAVDAASDGLGVRIPPLTKKFTDLQHSMQTTGIQLFGGAMQLLTRSTTALGQAAHTVGGIFVDWIAKINLYMQHQGNMNHLMAGAIGFLRQFGQIFGNLGMAFGHLLKMDPGIAHMIGNVIVAATGLLNLFTKLPAPIVKTAIDILSIYHYGGLAITILRKLADFAGLEKLARSWGLINSEAKTFAGIGAKGWLGIGLIAAGIIYAGIESNKASPEIQKFIDTINQKIDSESASQAIINISGAIGALQMKMNSFSMADVLKNWNQIGPSGKQWAQSFGNDTRAVGSDFVTLGKSITDAIDAPLHGQLPDLVGVLKNVGHTFKDIFVPGAGAAQVFQHSMDALRSAENKLIGQQGNLAREAGDLSRGFASSATTTSRLGGKLGDLSRTTHLARTGGMSFASALTLMNLAGVHASDSFVLMREKVQMLIDGYRTMGVQQGILRNATNAATFGIEFQSSKVNALIQGYQSFLQVVTGSANAFVGFAQNIQSVDQALAGTGGRARTVVTTFGTTTRAARTTGASFSGLNSSSLQLRSTWNSALTSAGGMLTSLLAQSAAAGMGTRGYHLLTQAGKDLTAQLLQGAKGSQQNTAQLYALAQEAGYHGADSFKALSKWVGNTHNTMGNLDKITTIFTRHSADLQTDVNNLAQAINKNLNQQMAQAIFLATGGAKWLNNFADSVLHAHGNIRDMIPSAQKLADQLLQNTHNTQAAHKEFDTFAIQLGLTKQKADNLWNSLHHLGQEHVTPTVNVAASGHGVIKAYEQGLASKGKSLDIRFARSGYRIPGYGGGDKHLIMAEAGETVVPKELTPAVAGIMKSHGVPGFRSGGTVGDAVPFMSKQSSDFVGAASTQFMTDANSAFQRAVKTEIAAMTRAKGSYGGFGVTPNGPLQQYARALLDAYGWKNQWVPFNDIVMAESGWNVHATNPTSGAYGIPQALPPGKMAAAGPDWMTSGFTQLRWMMGYIKQRYGSPAAAWAFHLANNAYGDGTPFAKRGWALVGERGPELVKFSGGEKVVNSALSRGIITSTFDNSLPSPHSSHVSRGSASGGGDVYNIYVLDPSYSDEKALQQIKTLRRYKQRHGHVPLGFE